MFLNVGKMYCGTCCPLDADAIKEREARIEVRRARIEAKVGETQESEETEKKVSGTPTSLSLSSSGSYSESLEDEEEEEDEDEEGKEGEHGEEEDEDENEDEMKSPSSVDSACTLPRDSVVHVDPFFLIGDAENEEGYPFRETFNQQKEQSTANIRRIMFDGEVWVTNVKVGAEFREVRRRDQVKASRKERFEKQRAEAAACEEMYKALEENWNLSAEKTLPLELYEQIKEQEAKADRLLEKRETQIEEMSLMMAENDWAFEESLGFYQKDIMLMGDRIDEEMDKLFASFLNELTLIQEKYESEQEAMLREYDTEWEEMMNAYEKAERNALDEHQKLGLARLGAMGEKYEGVKEEMRTFRRSLEDDYRSLVLLFENYKFLSLLNTEKLDYNLKVVRRREVENLKMRSSLKRAVLKYRDIWNGLRKDFVDLVISAKKESKDVIKEAERLMRQNASGGKTLYHMAYVDYKKYMEMWTGAEEESKRRIILLLDIESFIFQKMLDIHLPKTELSLLSFRPKEVTCFMHNLDYEEELLKAERGDPEAFGPGMMVSLSAMSVGSAEGSGMGSKGDTQTGSSLTPRKRKLKYKDSLKLEWRESVNILPEEETTPAFEERVMRHLAHVMEAETGFLLEQKLRRLLSSMARKEKALVHFEHVVEALGVTTVSDMQLLARYMVAHSTVMKGIFAKHDGYETPVMESMGVSLTELLPSTFTSVESIALEKIQEKMSEVIGEVEVDGEGAADPPGLIIPPTVYCSSTPNQVTVEEETEGENDNEEEVKEEPVLVDEEEKASSSTKSMETPEGCHRRALTFDTDKSMVMTWYKDGDGIGQCNCQRQNGICTCDPPVEDPTGTDQNKSDMSAQAPPPSPRHSHHSAPSSSVGSDEFLFIQPNDVLKALAGFLKEFNRKTKVERPSDDELILEHLKKIRFPSREESEDYWSRFLPLVSNFGGNEFWDIILAAFNKYYEILKERNKAVEVVESVKRQNFELANLIQTLLKKESNGNLDLNRVLLPFC